MEEVFQNGTPLMKLKAPRFMTSYRAYVSAK